ncbi:MAG: hypothetical protein HZB61_01070 [Nitrospirae bacterium]|nr:hypothetical protein [Nitrospirota bacterium]
MNGNSQRFKEKPACSDKAAPFPTDVKCPHCGADVEMWNDEDDATCPLCGKTFNKEDSW